MLNGLNLFEPAKQSLSSYFIAQVELEQKYLILPELERDILDIFFEKNIPLNEFKIRIELYKTKIKARLQDLNEVLEIKSDIRLKYKQDEIKQQLEYKSLVNLAKDVTPKDADKFFSSIRTNYRLDLPSNRSVHKSCEKLVPVFLKLVAREQGTKVFRDYSLAPEFYVSWSKIRGELVNQIEQGKISKNSLTDLSIRFWRIK